LTARKGYQLVRCRRCRLVYVSPRPKSPAAIARLYTNDRYSTNQVAHSEAPGRMREAHWRAAQLERHARQRRGRLLDVGCSAGSFMSAARDKGWDTYGIDISAGAVDHAAHAFGLQVGVATLDAAPFIDGSFSVVTMFEYIEHLLDPAAALRGAWRLLEPGGLLVLTTPNVDGFVPRTTYQLLGRTIGAWEHPTPPHHLYQFSRRTLAALLRKSGFEVVASRTRPMGFRFTVTQLESAVIEAIKRKLSWRAPAAEAAETTSPARTSASRGTGARRRPRRVGLPRRMVSVGCNSLIGALYAMPMHWIAGDSMLVVARKPA
jgi:2-polyprenyl-3-methyl-5-hydroxy-6-metoxy-1,4-benzoquinol methylase